MKTLDDLKEIITQRKSYYDRKYGNSVEKQAKCLNYYRGQQISTEQKQKLKEKGRPIVKFNHIKAYVNLVFGEQIASKMYFKAILADGVSEDESVEITINDQRTQITMSKLTEFFSDELKKIEDENDGEYELSECFREGLAGRRSNIEVFIKEDKSIFPYKRKIFIKQRVYDECFPDPDAKEYDLDDSMDFIKYVYYSREELKAMHPDKKTEVDELPASGEKRELSEDELVMKEKYLIDNASDESTDDKWNKIRCIEYYYWEIEESFYVVAGGEHPFPIEKNEKSSYEKSFKQAQEIDPSFEYEFFPIEKKKWYVCLYCSGVVFSKEEINIDELPIAQYIADRVKSIKKLELRDVGLVDDIIDPQDYLNKAKGQEMAHLNSSIHSGIAAEEGALINPENWQKRASSPGFIGTIKKGMFDKWKEFTSKTLSQGHLMIGADASNQMKFITNLNTNVKGEGKASESGVAKDAMIQQGQKGGVSLYLDNFRRTRHLVAKKCLKYLCYLYNVDYNKLKVVIADDVLTPTAKYANWLEMKAMIAEGILDSPYGDLAIDASNISNKDVYRQRIKEVNAFKQWQQDQQMQEEARKAAIEDAQREGLIQ